MDVVLLQSRGTLVRMEGLFSYLLSLVSVIISASGVLVVSKYLEGA